MTEQEWRECVHPKPMLEWLRGRTSDRKVRLFACICARRIVEAINEVCEFGAASVVALSEDLADGRANATEVEQARANNWGIGAIGPVVSATYAEQATIAAEPFEAAFGAAGWGADAFGMMARNNRQSELTTQAAFVRDIFDDHFCSIAFSPEWHTDTALALARQMYDSRDFSAMPVLADALQDAGCDSADILGHCRGPNLHARGCWVVDLVLGKE